MLRRLVVHDVSKERNAFIFKDQAVQDFFGTSSVSKMKALFVRNVVYQ
jgi:hypothetical protein